MVTLCRLILPGEANAYEAAGWAVAPMYPPHGRWRLLATREVDDAS